MVCRVDKFRLARADQWVQNRAFWVAGEDYATEYAAELRENYCLIGWLICLLHKLSGEDCRNAGRIAFEVDKMSTDAVRFSRLQGPPIQLRCPN